MTIKSTLNSLKVDQLKCIYEQVCDYNTTDKSSYEFNQIIYNNLKDYSQNSLQQKTVKDQEILSLWKGDVLNIIQKKKVGEILQEDKEKILTSLTSLSVHEKEVDIQLEEICRNILILLYKSFSDQERKRFVDTLKQELEPLKVDLSKKEFEKILFSNTSLGAVGLPLLIIPIIANTMLKRLTQGFMGWLLVEILGQQAAKKAVLAFLAGPIGWGINIILIIGTAGFAFFKYQAEKKKLRFIQTIFSIYSYSYFNHRFNK
ncbi:MAG: hypothetical protein ACXITR_02855 [Cyanobacterium sp.]